MGRGIWVQTEIKRLAGAEAWVMVRHRNGLFKMPADAAVYELLTGVAHGWTLRTAVTRHYPGSVRVPLDEWMRAQHPPE